MIERPELHVWMPRPWWQVESIAETAKAQGVLMHALPVLEIEWLADVDGEALIAHSDTLIFTSQNAVRGYFHGAKQRHAIKDKKVVAIGEATAQCLLNFNTQCDYIARPPFSSESLLDDPTFWALGLQSVALISGVGGRNVLLERLQQAGVAVKKLAVYQRHKAKITERTMIEFIKTNDIKAVALTSVDVAEAVTAALQAAGMAEQQKTMVVFTFGERISKATKALGWQQVHSATKASQSALLELIINWRDRRKI